MNKQKKRASHYEQLYNQLTVSSIFPHLQESTKSSLQKHNIKENLISLDNYKNKWGNIDKLEDFFPDLSHGDNNKIKKQEDIKNENFKKLQNEFDL
ncbi:hypothetical protein [Lysinibacillus halotolerans]|uniref:Uncharacterized protein n=1 Tax=Lysinibacillus halotolerans TaxID=1368476 RepID=A0A3M8GZZ3_9BACI|nr:hypothetical protein [Lysinibacillus halotolerans]RNC95364.1 hypothetical protein EC501_18270 [Lysinibacillus halotolerans]